MNETKRKRNRVFCVFKAKIFLANTLIFHDCILFLFMKYRIQRTFQTHSSKN